MKSKKSLKKLDLSTEKISAISSENAKSINGGLFHSHFLCFQSKADAGCTSHTKCNGGLGGDGGGTILCIG